MSGPVRDGGLRPWTWGLAGAVLLLAGLAQLFWDQMDWGAEDFVALTILLAGGCLGYELVARATRRPWLRLAGGLAVLAPVLLVWAQLAVDLC